MVCIVIRPRLSFVGLIKDKEACRKCQFASTADHQCRNCGMTFDLPQHLARHQQKFCVGSNYADIPSLEQKYNNEFRNADPSRQPRGIPQRRPDFTEEEYRLELQKERIRSNGLAKREYEKVLAEIRKEQQRKFNANAQKDAVTKELRKLQKMEAGELAEQKQRELDVLNNRKKLLQSEEETLKHELDRFLGKKRELEMESATQLGNFKGKASQVRGQLNRARDLEDDYAIDQGKKLAELQHKKQSLEQQKKNIETGLQNIRQKRQEVGEIRGSNQDSPQKFPPSAYTFKPQPFDRVEEYRRLALQSESSEHTEERLKQINNEIGQPRQPPTSNSNQLINQRQQELEQLKREYQSNGGDDPAFYDKIQRLQNKYSIAGSRTQNGQQEAKVAPAELPHRPYQPPRNIEKSKVSESGSSSQQAINPFYNPNSPYEMYERFAVKPNQKTSPEYIIAPNTFGNDEKLLLEQRIAPDQSIEERVMSSVLAQQYDALQILARLPKDSEIYKLKLKQYQQLSKIRQDLVKQAHEQRLLKVKRQFEMQKRLAEKDLENDTFVDRMRMDLIKKKFGDSPMKSNRLQFSVMCDMVSGLPLEAHSCRVAFSVYHQGQQVTGVRQTQAKECERRENNQQCRIYERMDCAVQPRQSMIAAFDVLISHRQSPQVFKLYGYGTVKLTNQEMKLGLANYELTLFEPPYKPLASTQRETQLPNNRLFLRIFQGANPLDSEFVNPRDMSHKTQYAIFNAMMSSSFLNNLKPEEQQQQLQQSGGFPQSSQSVRKKQQQFQEQGPKGFEFKLIAVRTERPEQTVWVELALYEEEVPLTSKKNTPVSYKSQYKQTVDIARRNNNLAEARLTESFRVYEDLERIYRKNQRQLYLMIQLMQKVDGSSRLKGWHCLRLTNFQEMREGMVKVNMFAPEAQEPPFDMNKAQGKLRDEVEFEICQFLPTQEQIEKFSKASLPAENSRKAQRKKEPTEKEPAYEPSNTKKSITKRSFQQPSSRSRQPTQGATKQPLESMKSSKPSIRTVMAQNQPSGRSNQSSTSILEPSSKQLSKGQRPFILNNEMQYQQEPEQSLKTFDLHISMLMNVPGGIGICKLYVTVLDAKNRKVLPTEQFLPKYEQNGSVYSQQVGYTRHIDRCKMGPDAVVMIQIVSYNELDGEFGLLGVSIFPLFVDNEKEHYLTTGNYQIPVFWSMINEYMDIDYAFTLPRIPGMSILVKCQKSLNEKDVPEYQTGKYCTVFYEVDAMEMRVMGIQFKRERYTQKQSVQTLFKTKNKKYNAKEVKDYLDKNLLNNNKLLSLNALLPAYDKEFGFSINIDGLRQTEGTNFYLITVCLSPPASYYTGEKMDLVFMTSTNMNSHRCFPLYDNNTFSFNESYNQNSCFVIEVVEIQMVDVSSFDVTLNSYGYAIVPVFERGSKFVKAAAYELQLFDGDFPEQKIEKLKDYYKYLPDFQEKAKMVNNTTIQVKIVNNYFQSQHAPCTDPNQFRQKRVETTSKPKVAPAIPEQEKIQTLLPSTITKEKFFEYLDECVYKLYDEE